MSDPLQKPPLAVRGAQKRYGDRTVLSNLDLTVPHGCVKGLLGRNGAGKTTLIECVLGLERFDAGHAEVYGCAPGAFSDRVRARIGYVPQETNQFPWMTALTMLDFFANLNPAWNRAKCSALLERWAIPRHTLIGELSAGERQRLAIVRALASEPEFLLLDEPAASLDPAARRDFLKEVIELTVNRQSTVLFSTHIVSDLERISSDVAILADGRIVLDAPIDVLTDRVVRVFGDLGAAVRLGGTVLRAAKTPGQPALVRFDAGLEELQSTDGAAALRIERVSLEDVLIEVTA
jgi:ABC-2 type transport system ATP-binding protein